MRAWLTVLLMVIGLESTTGQTVQRKRIDRFIESTARLDTEAAIESLKRHTEGLDLAQLASSSPSSLYTIFFKQVVADRRVAKIYEAFEALPKEKRSKRANSVYHSSFTEYEKAWESFRKGELIFFELVPLHHAASVGLFLCACFDTPEELLEKVKDWESKMADPKYDAIQGVRHIPHYRYPDPLFVLNLLTIAGERNGRQLDDLGDRLDQLTKTITDEEKPLLKVDTVRMFKWNAKTNDTDFTHIARGAPVNADDVLVILPGFNRTSPHLSKPEVCQRLREEVSAWAVSD